VDGRTGQETNQRKQRKGAFWEDRYHAKAVESGDHMILMINYQLVGVARPPFPLVGLVKTTNGLKKD
jgi:hypothetical protein